MNLFFDCYLFIFLMAGFQIKKPFMPTSECAKNYGVWVLRVRRYSWMNFNMIKCHLVWNSVQIDKEILQRLRLLLTQEIWGISSERNLDDDGILVGKIRKIPVTISSEKLWKILFLFGYYYHYYYFTSCELNQTNVLLLLLDLSSRY